MRAPGRGGAWDRIRPDTTRGVLVIDGLTKSYGDRRALDDLSMDVPAGEVVGLLGPNGSGKTTATAAGDYI